MTSSQSPPSYKAGLSDYPYIARRYQEMAAKARIKAPEVFIVDSPEPDAGYSASGVMVITQGLLDILDEKEAVTILAHELGHAKHNFKHNHAYSKAEPVFKGSGFLLGLLAGHGLAHRMFSEEQVKESSQTQPDEARTGRRDFLKRTTRVIGTLAGFGVTNKLSPHVETYVTHSREYEADQEAIRLCGDADALISGLQKITDWNKMHGFHQCEHYPPMVERIRRIKNCQGQAL